MVSAGYMYWDKNHRHMREAFCLYQPEVSLGKVNMKEQWEQVTGNLFESGSRKAKSFAGDGGSYVYLGIDLDLEILYHLLLFMRV